MKRRSFLSAILAAGAAPAIVRADSLMKIIVPSQEIILPDFGMNEFTIEAYIKKPLSVDGGALQLQDVRVTCLDRYADKNPQIETMSKWTHVALTSAGLYINGVLKHRPTPEDRLNVNNLVEYVTPHLTPVTRLPAHTLKF